MYSFEGDDACINDIYRTCGECVWHHSVKRPHDRNGDRVTKLGKKWLISGE